MASCVEVGIQAQHNANKNTGNEACKEQLTYRTVSRYAVNNHRDTRRNDNADGAGCRNQCQHEFFIIALLQHRRHNHTADSRNSCRAGTGDCRKEHTYNDCDNGKAAADSAKEYACNVQQPAGNTTSAHQFTGEYEERNRHNGEGITACYEILRNKAECQLFCIKDICQRCNAQRKADRHSQHKTNNQCKEYY